MGRAGGLTFFLPLSPVCQAPRVSGVTVSPTSLEIEALGGVHSGLGVGFPLVGEKGWR